MACGSLLMEIPSDAANNVPLQIEKLKHDQNFKVCVNNYTYVEWINRYSYTIYTCVCP